jgi:Uma2 family endonuclease
MTVKIDLGQQSHPAGEERVLLHNVSWSTYEQLLADLFSQSGPRLTYDKGILEIMSPGPRHERLTDIIETLVKCLAEELNRNVYCLRSTTFRRKSFKRGFEPDSCFYVENESYVREKEIIDLSIDPPPDLVIEIDITSGSIDKLPIYAQMRIPEIWRHDGSKLIIYKLSGSNYVESNNSMSFPSINSIGASDFIRQSKNLPSTEFLKSLRQWIKSL